MKQLAKKIVLGLGILAVGNFAAFSAAAGEFPDKPVRVIIAWSAGGGVDATTRAVSAVAYDHFGQPMIVQVRSGGSGVVGTEAAANAKPDGYTLFMGETTSMSILPYAQDVPYSLDSFIPLGQLTALPLVITVPADSPWKTFGDFVKAGKANPGKYKYAAVNFASEHFMFAGLESEQGAKFSHFPVDGGGPMLVALLGGHVDTAGLYPPVVAPHLKDGKLRALGVAADERWHALPDVPTLKEQGYDVTGGFWVAAFALKGTPQPVLTKLKSSLKSLVGDKSFTKLMSRMGSAVVYKDADTFKKDWVKEQKSFADLIKKLAK